MERSQINIGWAAVTALFVFGLASTALAGPVTKFDLTYQNAAAAQSQIPTISWAHEWTPITPPNPPEPPVPPVPPIPQPDPEPAVGGSTVLSAQPSPTTSTTTSSTTKPAAKAKVTANTAPAANQTTNAVTTSNTDTTATVANEPAPAANVSAVSLNSPVEATTSTAGPTNDNLPIIIFGIIVVISLAGLIFYELYKRKPHLDALPPVDDLPAPAQPPAQPVQPVQPYANQPYSNSPELPGLPILAPAPQPIKPSYRFAIGSLVVLALGIIVGNALWNKQPPASADVNTPEDKGKYVVFTGWKMPTSDWLEQNPEKVKALPYDGILTRSQAFSSATRGGGYKLESSVFATLPAPMPDFTETANRWQRIITTTGALRHSLQYVSMSVKDYVDGSGTTLIHGAPPFTDTTSWDKTANPSDNTIMNRWRATVETIHTAGFKGVMIDNEHYRSEGTTVSTKDIVDNFDIPPTYNGLNTLGHNNQTLAVAMQDPVFAAKAQPAIDAAKHYGQEMVKIMRDTYGNEPVDIILAFAGEEILRSRIPTAPWYWDGTNVQVRGDSHYELLPAFLDGLISEAAGSNVSIHDGNESSFVNADYKHYDYTTPNVITADSTTSLEKDQAFANNIHSLSNISQFSTIPNVYAANIKVAYDRWLDASTNYQTTPWYYQFGGQWWEEHFDNTDPRAPHPVPIANPGKWVQNLITNGKTEDDNYFSPALYQSSLISGIGMTDRYVWVYSQMPDMAGFYAGTNIPNPVSSNMKYDVPLSQNYTNAVVNAHSGNGIAAPNCAPSLTTPPTIMVGHAATLSPQVSVSDPTGYTTVPWNKTLPAGMSEAANGNLSWTPSASQVGSQTLTWRFSNGMKIGSCTSTIDVTDSIPTVTLDVQADANTLNDNQPVVYSLHATNGGNDTAEAAKVSVTMPDHWTFTSVTNGTGTVSGQVVEIDLGTMAVGATKDLSLTLQPVR